MNKRPLPFFLISIAILAACENGTSKTSQTFDSSTSIAESSNVTSSTETSSSALSTSSNNPTIQNVILTPAEAPAKENSTYPIGKTVSVGGIVFAFQDIMGGNQQQLDSNNKATTALDVIQAKALTGAIYNTTALAIMSVKVIFIDKTSDYNLIYPIENVYGGDAAHPLTEKAQGGEVEKSLSSTGYKQITQVFTFPDGVNYVTLANDSDSSGDTSSNGRAVYFTSIEVNPVA